jgi:hypothetical protein
MRSNARLRAIWRGVDGPVPMGEAHLNQLASRIADDSRRALRARKSWTRAALSIGFAAAAAAAMAIAMIPKRPAPTLLGAIKGDEASARTFEVAMVGPRDGAWVIAAAIGTDR